MMNKRKQKPFLFLTVLMFVVVSSLGTADAMRFNVGDDTSIDCDVTINYRAGWRSEDRDSSKIGGANANSDDGNLNFDQWSMINNKLTLLADIEVKHKNFGIFVRPKALYDHVYMTDNDGSGNTTNSAFVAGLISSPDEWPDEVEDAHGKDVRILDLFAYGSFDIAGHLLELRVGRQSISWGQPYLIGGGISSAQNHLDLVARTDVASEVKEYQLPSEAVYALLELTPALELQAYYQWQWYSHEFFEGGSFFSSADFLDELEAPISGVFTRGKDDDASDSGQYGVALTYQMEKLNGLELGLYYVNYHDHSPQVIVSPPTYNLTFTENIELYGASFATQIGKAVFMGEFSYRRDFQFDPGVYGNYWQTDVAYRSSIIPPPQICDLVVYGVNVGANQEIGKAGDDNDTFAMMYYIITVFQWYQVVNSLDTALQIVYLENIIGTNELGTEGSATMDARVNLTYNNVYRATIGWTGRFNSVRNGSSDKDTLYLTLNYSF